MNKNDYRYWEDLEENFYEDDKTKRKNPRKTWKELQNDKKVIREQRRKKNTKSRKKR